MIFLFLLTCAKHPTPPERLLSNDDCLQSLRVKLEENDCLQLAYATKDYTDMLIRCYKEDSLRKNMWDTNWFRLSASDIYYSDPEADYFIKEHTICVDGTWRIESYPPDFATKQNIVP